MLCILRRTDTNTTHYHDLFKNVNRCLPKTKRLYSMTHLYKVLVYLRSRGKITFKKENEKLEFNCTTKQTPQIWHCKLCNIYFTEYIRYKNHCKRQHRITIRYNSEYNQNNSKILSKYQLKWYHTNKERILRKNQKWRDNNRDKLKEKYQKKKLEKGEEMRKYQLEWYHKNKERINKKRRKNQ